MQTKDKMKKACVVLFLLFGITVYADVYDDIAIAIRTGDSKQIASWFSNNVDLTLNNQEDVYSKAQAELLLKDFFSKNPPKSFNVVHKGSSKEGTLFAVGNLNSSSGKTFRVSFVLKANQGKHIIQELRFEKGD